MAESSSNPSPKRRKLSPARLPTDPTRPRWQTQTEQQIYSSKLAHALLHLRRPESGAAAVREAADRVLAVSAKAKTRWSRAILTNRLSRRLARINKKHKKTAKPAAVEHLVKKPAVHKRLPPLQRKVKVLSRLVPGCRNISLPNLLEETSDYIAALEMQVKAMTFITGLLNGGASAAAVGGGADSDQHFNSA